MFRETAIGAFGFVLASMLSLGVASAAPDCFVTGDPNAVSPEYETIQKALNDAIQDCKDILVEPSYNGVKESVTIQDKVNVTIAGETGGSNAFCPSLDGVVQVQVNAGGALHAFTLSDSAGVTIKNLDVTGASKEAIYLCGSGISSCPSSAAPSPNTNITIDANCIHENALPPSGKSQQANGGIFIARNNSATVQYNEIVNNGRNGIQLESDQPGGSLDPIDIVGNRIRLNGYNGILVGRMITSAPGGKVNFTGNFVCDNGSELPRFGATGGRYGLLYERSNYPHGLLDLNLSLTDNKFFGNHGMIVANKSSIDIGNWDQACDSGDANNGTTTGTESACPVTQAITRPPECSLQCTSNAQCAGVGFFCDKAQGSCQGSGTCERRPIVCPLFFDPVCGCDHRTYSNDCFAAMAGVSVDFKGECSP